MVHCKTPPLRAVNVTVERGNRPVLRSAELTLLPGVTVLLGRNGAGKSTLISTLLGLLSPRTGHVEAGGQRLTANDWRALHQRTGWLPQGFGFPPHMTVWDFVAYAAWLKEVPRGGSSEHIQEALKVTDMISLSKRRMGSLSGGEAQRAGMAAALVARPSILLLDEPTAGLDPVQRTHLHDIVSRLTSGEHGDVAVLLCTHLFEDAAACMDRLAVLADGRIVHTVDAGSLTREKLTADVVRGAVWSFLAES